MYISDVIERAKALHPTEYTVQEYINWCDELSADIRRNYDVKYARIKQTSSNVLLPDGVGINDISKIIMDGKELKKTDLRDFGLEYEYYKDGVVVKKTDGECEEFEIIYEVPHTPIRYVDDDYQITFYAGEFRCENLPLIAGDTAVFTIGLTTKTSYKIQIVSREGDKFTYTGATIPTGTKTTHVYLQFMDKTLLPAPYDTAYIDFVNAKVSLYQGDTDAYATFMGQYNYKLEKWKQYLTRNKPRIERKWKNWY